MNQAQEAKRRVARDTGMTWSAYVRFDGIEGATEDEAIDVLRGVLELQPFDWYLDDVEAEVESYNGGATSDRA
jgi:hypothetical protein